MEEYNKLMQCIATELEKAFPEYKFGVVNYGIESDNVFSIIFRPDRTHYEITLHIKNKYYDFRYRSNIGSLKNSTRQIIGKKTELYVKQIVKFITQSKSDIDIINQAIVEHDTNKKNATNTYLVLAEALGQKPFINGFERHDSLSLYKNGTSYTVDKNNTINIEVRGITLTQALAIIKNLEV